MKRTLLRRNLGLAGILFAVLLILGGLATWDERKTIQEKDDEKAKNRLADFKAEDVIELDYYSKGPLAQEDGGAKPDDNPKTEGLVQVSAVKKDGTWRLTKPVDVQADAATIEGLVKVVTDYTYAKVVTDKRDVWADFGLVEPQRHVTFRIGGDAPRTLTVYLGNKAPVGYNVYLRTSKDDRVLLGSQHILVSSAKTLTDFRDKTLLKIDEAKLKTLAYQRKGEPEIVVAKADGKYQVVKPEKLDADPAAIRDFIEELNGVRVTGFQDVPDAALKAAFAAPDYQLTWTGESGEASTLKVASVGPRLLAAFDPAQRVFALPDELKAKLKKDLADFRNRRILEPDALEAKTVDIDGDVYKSIDGNWYTAADAAKFDAAGKYTGDPKAKPVEKANVRAFMVDLEFAKTDRFLPPDSPVASAGTGQPPVHRIMLSYNDPAKKSVTIELFKADGAPDRYLVRRSGAAAVFRVAKSAFNSMTPSAGPAAGGPGGDAPPGLDEEGGGDVPPPVPGKNSGLNPPDANKKAG